MIMIQIEEKDIVNVTLELNARLQPLHRGEIFEDMFEEMFRRFGIGEITGAGTLQMPSFTSKPCSFKRAQYSAADLYSSMESSAYSQILSLRAVSRGAFSSMISYSFCLFIRITTFYNKYETKKVSFRASARTGVGIPRTFRAVR